LAGIVSVRNAISGTTSARPLSVVITGGRGTDSELAAQSSINSLPANPIVEKAPLFTGFKTTSLNGVTK
jgi:hypothetical protein